MSKIGSLCTFLAIHCLVGCSAPKALNWQEDGVDSRPTLIFIHGYYGSTLRDVSTKRRVFLTAREILFGRNALSLHQQELGTPSGPNLEVEGLLGEVSVVPWLYSVDVYSKFVGFTRELPGVQVVPFAYDWRQDLSLAVNQLDQLVKTLRAKGVKKIVIAAHSMGGLVATYYLGYGAKPLDEAKLDWSGAKEINKIIYMGVPFSGAFGVFRNMQRGAAFPWNRYLLPNETVASFPASYALLPSIANFIDSKNPGHLISEEILNAGPWEKYGLGLLQNKSVTPAQLLARHEFTGDQISKANWFLGLCNFHFKDVEPPANLEVVNLVGKGTDTVDTAFLNPDTNEFIFDTDKPETVGLDKKKLFAEGDGTVTLLSAKLPRLLGQKAKLLYSGLGHDRLFEDENLHQELKTTFKE
ncbi:MAG: lipase/acyltransferase domain-containing protein [Bdellovibrionota bacterium]